MGLLSAFFAYARFVAVLVGRVVVKLLAMGAAPFAGLSRRVLGKPQVEVPDADKQLLGTERIDEAAVQKDLVDDWVDVSDEDKWEPGARNLLDDVEKPSAESCTEDELIELSDGEERHSPVSALYPAKRSRSSLSDHVSAPRALATGTTPPLLF
ncbi:hypothetical protein PF005_g2641 [Phytophthora fragariae]|uniref:Uncharacterized protein n=2 Tax=Phytophthora TaxID=4783 RepID=A0A6A3F7X2_9STRA|nr:hypothetical protein PF003_g21943 [Phytophthora fragariae]KAE9011217.1 hypothetical protein PR002_g15148 [Phytophthora rubi]KAE8941935.1 hypothetical protein PF009_g8289 [Phytophthora fragariae]KAE9017383.1 hypothetical protein PR001_g14413 [Phytophthora rubi]KAE9027391.1 hypothetical protein PF011_g2065 [Phytophthora fragariae]